MSKFTALRRILFFRRCSTNSLQFALRYPSTRILHNLQESIFWTLWKRLETKQKTSHCLALLANFQSQLLPKMVISSNGWRKMQPRICTLDSKNPTIFFQRLPCEPSICWVTSKWPPRNLHSSLAFRQFQKLHGVTCWHGTCSPEVSARVSTVFKCNWPWATSQTPRTYDLNQSPIKQHEFQRNFWVLQNSWNIGWFKIPEKILFHLKQEISSLQFLGIFFSCVSHPQRKPWARHGWRRPTNPERGSDGNLRFFHPLSFQPGELPRKRVFKKPSIFQWAFAVSLLVLGYSFLYFSGRKNMKTHSYQRK